MPDIQQGFPNVSSPFIDQQGRINQAWLQFLISLWNRTGQGPGRVVTSFDGRVGDVTLNSDDITSALGYLPVSPELIAGAWNNFILTPTQAPAAPDTLTLSLSAGVGMIAGGLVDFAAIDQTVATNSIYDWWLNTDGTYTIATEPVANFTSLPRYTEKLHVWRIQTNDTKIVTIALGSDTYPTIKRPDDRAATVDDFVEDFYIYNVTTNWSAGLTTTYGQLLVTSAGNVYQVAVPGITGGSAPTSTAEGAITDGAATLFYYCQSPYLGMFRYAQNNGTEYYFCATGLRRICHRTVITGSPLGPPAGTTMSSLVKQHILGMFFHTFNDRQDSADYQFGMKMIAADFIWINTTSGTNTTAASTPFSGSYNVGDTVVDGSITWESVYASYASQKWFWLDVDRTFLTYRSPDSHDSYASTFISMVARYIQLTADYDWLSDDSPQPNDSGFYTYKEVFDLIVYQNLDIQISSFLTKTFQYDINPLDGSSFTTQYLQDNCESVSGYKDAAYIYGLLGDSVRQTSALSNEAYIASGVYGLFDVTYNVWAYSTDVSVADYYNSTDIQFYPAYEAQFWPQLHNVTGITTDMMQGARLWVSQRWEAWWSDKGKDLFPLNVLGFVATVSWQDSGKAYSFIENTERYFLTNGTTIINEYAYYLDIKDSMIPEYRVLEVNNEQIIFEDSEQNIINFVGFNQPRTLRLVSLRV